VPVLIFEEHVKVGSITHVYILVDSCKLLYGYIAGTEFMNYFHPIGITNFESIDRLVEFIKKSSVLSYSSKDIC